MILEFVLTVFVLTATPTTAQITPHVMDRRYHSMTGCLEAGARLTLRVNNEMTITEVRCHAHFSR